MKRTLLALVVFAGPGLAQTNTFSLLSVSPQPQPYFQSADNIHGPNYPATAPQITGSCQSQIWDDSTHHYIINNYSVSPSVTPFTVGVPWACSSSVTVVRQSWGSTTGDVWHTNPDTGRIVYGVEAKVDVYWTFMGVNYDEWDDEAIFCDDYTSQISKSVYPSPQPC